MVVDSDDLDVPWGERLRRWRVGVRCWSQQEFVDQVVRLAFEAREERGTRLEVRLVGRWENGEVRRPQPVYRRLLARLGAPAPADPRPLTEPGEARLRAGRSSISPSQSVNDVGDDLWCDDGGSVLRRDFLKLGSIAATVGMGGALPDGQGDVGGTVRTELVDGLRRRLGRLRTLDDYLGGADTFDLYVGEVKATLRLLQREGQPPALRAELLGLHAEQAQQAGWAAFDAGWRDVSRDLFQLGYDAASECVDPGLSANSLALLAYQLVETGGAAGDATRASLQLASEAAVHPRVRSLLFMRGAWTYSRLGDSNATADALDRAAAALSAETDDHVPGYAKWVNSTELAIMKGRCWSTLKKPLRAIPHLEAALNEYGDAHARDKALYSSWLADSYLDVGEAEKAHDIVSTSMALVRDVASVRPKKRLQEVGVRLGRISEVPRAPD